MNARSLLLLMLAVVTSKAPSFQKPVTIPLPRSLVQRPGAFTFSAQTRIILGDGTTRADREVLEILNARLEKHGRRRLALTDERSVRRLTKGSIYLATPRSDFTRSALRDRGARLQPSMGPEGYVLDIREEGIVLVASSDQGRFYGMMTLLGLLRPDGRRLTLPLVTIHDWPSRPVRGFRLATEKVDGEALETLCRLIPLCSALKLNTVVIDLPRDADARADWSSHIDRIRRLAETHRMELRLDARASPENEASVPCVRLGFLPPPQTMTASIAAWARAENPPNGEFLPVISLDSPSLYASQWLEYCTAWIAENAWSDTPVDLGAVTKVLCRISCDGQADGDILFRDFTLLQNSPIEGSWDELWVPPLARWPCLHSLARRHAAESLTAAAGSLSAGASSALASAVSVRIRFLGFLARRLRAEELLARAGEGKNPGSHDEPLDAERHESVQMVIDCLDGLESALLEASRPGPLTGGTAELIGAVAFQRHQWSHVMTCLEKGEDLIAVVAPARWLLPPERIRADSSAAVVFRRQVVCSTPPLQARLVLTTSEPVQGSVNGIPLPQERRLLQNDRSGHPSILVFDITGSLRAGENRVDLSFTRNADAPWLVSALLELQYRDGSRTTIPCDSLWQASVLPHPPGGDGGPWEAAVVLRRSGCPTWTPRL